ncbi:HNH endonuclease [Myxococcota bacterium]|nr:HNH endonuclease [Myxococcota bacterium]
MTSKEAEVHIFWRDDDHAPFTYAGLAQAISIADEVPVKVRWSFAHKKVIPGVDGVFPDEVDASPKRAYIEGATKAVLVNAYERNAAARNECVHHHGTVCRVCGFDFGKTYGEMGIGFIHIHHKLPIAEIGEAYTLNPINDLVPVCPNCHAMLHRSHPPMTVEQLILTLKKVGKT